MSGYIFILISFVATLKETPVAQSINQIPPASSTPDFFDKLIETIDLILLDLVKLREKKPKEL